MALTRTDAKAAINHVLGRGDGTPLKASLIAEGIDGIFSLVGLNENSIDTLCYKDENGALKPLRLSDIRQDVLEMILTVCCSQEQGSGTPRRWLGYHQSNRF